MGYDLTVIFLDRTPDQLASPCLRFAGNPHLSGKDGGRTLNLHQFYRDGVTLLGRLRDVKGIKILLAPDLKENLEKADEVEANLVKWVDGYIEKNRIDAPKERLPVLRDGFASPEILELDLEKAGISTLIWAMGYSFDFSLVKLPVFDEFGFPVTERGATKYPGLYLAGLPWLMGQKSGLLLGVGDQAADIAGRIF